MPLTVRSVGSVRIIELSGDFTVGRRRLGQPLDLQGRPLTDLGDALLELLDRGDRNIVLDLRRMGFVDSGGLGHLVVCKTRAVARGGDVKLLGPTRRVLDLLRMTRLTSVFEIHDDERAAVASF